MLTLMNFCCSLAARSRHFVFSRSHGCQKTEAAFGQDGERERPDVHRQRKRGKRDKNHILTNLTAALCAPKQLCPSCGHLELFSSSYKYRHACIATPDRTQCTYSPANLRLTSKKNIARLVEPEPGHFRTKPFSQTRCVTPICDCSTLIHGRVATRFEQ